MKQIYTFLCLFLLSGVVSADDHWVSCGNMFEFSKSFQRVEENRSPSSDDFWKDTQFRNYIMGWVDRDFGLVTNRINYPEVWRYGALFHIVQNWLEEHPEQWHQHRGICVALALKEAYGLK